MKTTVCISLDIETAIELKKRNMNVSSLVNDFLNSYLNVKNKQSKVGFEKVDEEIKKKSIELMELQQEKRKYLKEIRDGKRIVC